MGRVARYKREKSLEKYKMSADDDYYFEKGLQGEDVSKSKEEKIPYAMRMIMKYKGNRYKKNTKIKESKENNKEKSQNKDSSSNKRKRESDSTEKDKKRQKQNKNNNNPDSNTQENPNNNQKKNPNFKVEMYDGESYQSYSRRVGEEARKLLKSEDLKLKTEGKTAEKRKARMKQRQQLKKLKKQKGAKVAKEDSEALRQIDSIKFGEVAEAPPTFSVVPKQKKKMEPDNPANKIKFRPKPERIVQALKKVEELSPKEIANDKNKVDLSLVRQRVIQGYRELKKRKRQEKEENKS